MTSRRNIAQHGTAQHSIMGTADGTPKKDLVLTRSAMPKPVDFIVGRYRARGIQQQQSIRASPDCGQAMPNCSDAAGFRVP